MCFKRFFTWWQDILIEMIAPSLKIDLDGHGKSPSEDVASLLSNFIICIEMMFMAGGYVYIFVPPPFNLCRWKKCSVLFIILFPYYPPLSFVPIYTIVFCYSFPPSDYVQSSSNRRGRRYLLHNPDLGDTLILGGPQSNSGDPEVCVIYCVFCLDDKYITY